MPKKQSPKKKPNPQNTTPKNNKKTMIILITTILMILAASIGGYFLIKHLTKKPSPTTTPTTEQPPKNPESKQPAPTTPDKEQSESETKPDKGKTDNNPGIKDKTLPESKKPKTNQPQKVEQETPSDKQDDQQPPTQQPAPAEKNNPPKSKTTPSSQPTQTQSAPVLTLSAKTDDDLTNTKEEETYQFISKMTSEQNILNLLRSQITRDVNSVKISKKMLISTKKQQLEKLQTLIERCNDSKNENDRIAADSISLLNEEISQLNTRKNLLQSFIEIANENNETERAAKLQKELDNIDPTIKIKEKRIEDIGTELKGKNDKIDTEITTKKNDQTEKGSELLYLQDDENTLKELKTSLETIVFPEMPREIDNSDDPQYWTKNRFGKPRHTITYYEERMKQAKKYENELKTIETRLNNIQSRLNEIKPIENNKK